MISYLGSLAQFSPAAGRAGRCRQMSLCVGSTRRALARQPRRAARAARGLVPSPQAACLLPPRPQRALPVGSQEVLRQEPGPVCRVGGGGFSGAEFAPCPSPASFLQRGWGGSSLEFLSPFVLRTAGGVFWPVNFFLALPQFKKAPSDCSQGLRPVLTLSNAAAPLRSAPSCWRRVRASGVLFCWELLLGT